MDRLESGLVVYEIWGRKRSGGYDHIVEYIYGDPEWADEQAANFERLSPEYLYYVREGGVTQ